MKNVGYKNFKLLCRIFESSGVSSHSLREDINNADWGGVFQLADGYHVLPALYVALKRRELLGSLDKDICDFLEGVYELNLQHNQLLKREALSVARLLNSIDIQPILLKGMAGLLSGLYEDEGERLIGDIDILVNLPELPSVLEVMLGHGYICDPEIRDQVFSSSFHKHELTLMTESWSVKIDLHVRPTGPSGRDAFVSIEGAMTEAEAVELGGARFLLPPPLFRLMHNFYHAQYLDRSYLEGNINLRQLIDWVKLWQRYGNMIDISAMEHKLRIYHQISSLRLYVLNAERYLGMPIPAGVKTGWLEELLFRRQRLSLHSSWFRSINRFSIYFLYGAQMLLAPERLRLKYGDLPLKRLIALRITGLLNFRWYWRRFEDVKKVLWLK
jgi:hypothetical protein